MSEEKNQNEIEEVTNEDEHKDVEHYCYLCRRPESAAGKMLELPNNIFICTDCMQRTLNSMGNGQFGFIDARNMDLDSMDITKMMIFTISLMTTMNVEKRNMKKCNYSVSLKFFVWYRNMPVSHKNLDNKVPKAFQYILFFGDVFNHLS